MTSHVTLTQYLCICLFLELSAPVGRWATTGFLSSHHSRWSFGANHSRSYCKCFHHVPLTLTGPSPFILLIWHSQSLLVGYAQHPVWGTIAVTMPLWWRYYSCWSYFVMLFCKSNTCLTSLARSLKGNCSFISPWATAAGVTKALYYCKPTISIFFFLLDHTAQCKSVASGLQCITKQYPLFCPSITRVYRQRKASLRSENHEKDEDTNECGEQAGNTTAVHSYFHQGFRCLHQWVYQFVSLLPSSRLHSQNKSRQNLIMYNELHRKVQTLSQCVSKASCSILSLYSRMIKMAAWIH